LYYSQKLFDINQSYIFGCFKSYTQVRIIVVESKSSISSIDCFIIHETNNSNVGLQIDSDCTKKRKETLRRRYIKKWKGIVERKMLILTMKVFLALTLQLAVPYSC
jgi:hypothetical protein